MQYDTRWSWRPWCTRSGLIISNNIFANLVMWLAHPSHAHRSQAPGSLYSSMGVPCFSFLHPCDHVWSPFALCSHAAVFIIILSSSSALTYALCKHAILVSFLFLFFSHRPIPPTPVSLLIAHSIDMVYIVSLLEGRCLIGGQANLGWNGRFGCMLSRLSKRRGYSMRWLRERVVYMYSTAAWDQSATRVIHSWHFEVFWDVVSVAVLLLFGVRALQINSKLFHKFNETALVASGGKDTEFKLSKK